MNVIKIPVAMVPHVQRGNPTGYYLIAERLFTRPVSLGRRQFAGYSDGLLLTVGGLSSEWDTLLKMAINLPAINGKSVTWLAGISQYKSPGGFRMYLPGKQFLMPSAGEGTTHLWGEFVDAPTGEGRLYYLRVPMLGGNVLLGRMKIHEIGN